MFKKKIKQKPLYFCVRIVLAYVFFLLIAKYTPVFGMGLDPKGKFLTNFVLVALLYYRFTAICIVPMVLVVWLGEKIIKETKSE